MKRLFQLIFLALLVSLTTSAAAETHAKVQAALDWQLPLNQCRRPKPLITNQQVVAAGGTYFQAPSSSSNRSPATAVISDVDHYQIKRFERKNKTWESCVKRYKAELLEQFVILKDSATYGLTEPQAKAVLIKLANIQAVIVSPEGKSTIDEMPITKVQSEPSP